MVMLLVLEKRFIRADNLGVFMEALAHAGAETDESLNTFRWQKGIAENFFGALANAVHATSALNEADDRPGQIVIYDDGSVLKILTFAKNVGQIGRASCRERV